MKAKKTKGAARPSKATASASAAASSSASASTQKLRLRVPFWVQQRTVIDAHMVGVAQGHPVRRENIDRLVAQALTQAIAAGDLLPEFEESLRARPDCRSGMCAGMWSKPSTLTFCLDRATVREFAALARAHGFTLHQGLAQVLAWSAAHELPPKFAAFEPADDEADEAWKKGGSVS